MIHVASEDHVTCTFGIYKEDPIWCRRLEQHLWGHALIENSGGSAKAIEIRHRAKYRRAEDRVARVPKEQVFILVEMWVNVLADVAYLGPKFGANDSLTG